MEYVEPFPLKAEDCKHIGDLFEDHEAKAAFPLFDGKIQYLGSVIMNVVTKEYAHIMDIEPGVLYFLNLVEDLRVAVIDEKLKEEIRLYRKYSARQQI